MLLVSSFMLIFINKPLGYQWNALYLFEKVSSSCCSLVETKFKTIQWLLNIAFAVFSDIWTTVLFRNRNDTEKITHNIKFNIKLRKTSNSTLNEAT